MIEIRVSSRTKEPPVLFALEIPLHDDAIFLSTSKVTNSTTKEIEYPCIIKRTKQTGTIHPPTKIKAIMLLELSLYARNLKDVAGAFKGTSDPFAVVTKMASNPNEKPVGKYLEEH